MNTISIIGCGWLGLPLAEKLIEEGYRINGTTTTPAKITLLQQKRIVPYLVTLDPKLNLSDETFFDCDLLLINIPPSTYSKGPDYHPQQIASLVSKINQHQIKNVFYISSTSVYPENNAIVDENMELAIENERQQALLLSEQTLQSGSFCLNILRCGGLMGYDRQPHRFLSKSFKSKMKKSVNTPVNYIHRDDVIAIISALLQTECTDQIFNLVAPEHPLRKEFINEDIEEDESNPSYKIVNSKKIIRFLRYQFKYPNPLEFK